MENLSLICSNPVTGLSYSPNYKTLITKPCFGLPILPPKPTNLLFSSKPNSKTVVVAFSTPNSSRNSAQNNGIELFASTTSQKTTSVGVNPQLASRPFPLVRKSFRLTSISCQSNDSESASVSDSESVSPSNSDAVQLPDKLINKRIALLSSVGALGLFLSSRLDFGVSLSDLTALASPFEQALSNGKPTVVEFYADWCEVCRELAPEVYNVEQQYRDRVNFVMLNVDNTKWEQEIDEFGVEGIPHFAFLDKDGNEQGSVVGKLPRQFFFENVDALASGKDSIPHARAVGQYSNTEARRVHQVPDPRSHG